MLTVGSPSSKPADRAGPTGAPIAVRAVSKWFGEPDAQFQALAELDIDVEPGEFASVIGPSGCGKSTLLRIVGGLLAHDAGAVTVAGTTPTQARATKELSFTPQAPALMPWRTVRRNVTLLRELNTRRAAHRPLSETEAIELLEAVGLGGHLDRYPRELSAGMRQRVALVRGFVLGAPILLMDEPFSALDEITRDEMRYLLLDLWQHSGPTVLFVTHSIPEAVILSDRVFVMARSPGRVVHVETVTLDRPRTVAMEDDPQFHQHLRNVRAALRQGSGR